jgi:hypothetical protein
MAGIKQMRRAALKSLHWQPKSCCISHEDQNAKQFSSGMAEIELLMRTHMDVCLLTAAADCLKEGGAVGVWRWKLNFMCAIIV